MTWSLADLVAAQDKVDEEIDYRYACRRESIGFEMTEEIEKQDQELFNKRDWIEKKIAERMDALGDS